MTTWTNDLFVENVQVGDKTYRNCGILHCGCYKKAEVPCDCRTCNIPLLFPKAAQTMVESKEMRE